MSTTLALDLDGTLLSCAPRHCALMRAVCVGDGMPASSWPRFWAAKREGANNVAALRQLGHPQPEPRAAAWAREIEHWPWLGFDRLLPGVAEALASTQHRIVVLTARRERFFLQQQLDRLGLTRRIHDLIVVPPTEAAARKAEALRRLQPQAFIGDTESDAEAADAAGQRFLALACGMRSPAFWARHGRPSFNDLPAALAALEP
jgi:phosphoglycolate phosphatase-like HAD superfamily hydrolase